MYFRTRSFFLRLGVLQRRRYHSSYHTKTIDKVLIANRGEIACRVMRTAQKLGVQTVAVYSDVDVDALHVSMADEAYNIGPAPSQESYLVKDNIINVALSAKCQAIHPGYGFLSENAEFAELCSNKGLIFIGPPADAMRNMGIKSTSKAIMSAAGVPIIEGYHGDDQSSARLQQEAERIGFPVMIKAVRGGGGKGMRISKSSSDFISQLESAQRESLKSFGDDSVLLEKFIEAPRHIEVQIFGDTLGNYVYLFERDCSVQRRHQKIIEEAPAPGVGESLRMELGEAAVRAARAVGYVGAGTVEFIVDKNTLKFHFMEMNTRLQVEHPITEMITGVDLVEWQFKVASGKPLPLTQNGIKLNGHAFESRIYAENPFKGFLPGAGHLSYLVTPQSSPDVRVETGVKEDDEISVHYDPMIAKLVVWGTNRREALLKMRKQLSEYHIAGLDTNINFLLRLCDHEEFLSGNVHTNFIDEHQTELLSPRRCDDHVLIQAVVANILYEEILVSKTDTFLLDRLNPFISEKNFRLNHQYVRKFSYMHDDQEVAVEVTYVDKNTFLVRIGNSADVHKVTGSLSKNDNILKLTCTIDKACVKSSFTVIDNDIYIFTKDGDYKISTIQPEFLSSTHGAVSGIQASDTAVAPMPGVVEKIFVQTGDNVKSGDPLLVIIAMKMEYTIRAPRDGCVKKISCSVGESVAKNAILVQLNDER